MKLRILTYGFQEWVSHVETTYIGSLAKKNRNLIRNKPLFKVDSWSQYNQILTDGPLTTNGCEGYNNAFNGSSNVNASLWSTFMHIREEESLVKGRWRENIRQGVEDTSANKRKISLKKKWLSVKQLCEIILEYHGDNRIEYLHQVAAAQE